MAFGEHLPSPSKKKIKIILLATILLCMYNIHIHTQTNNVCERVISYMQNSFADLVALKRAGYERKKRAIYKKQKAWTREKKQPSQRGLRSAFHSFSLSGLLLTPRSFKAD